MLIYHVQGTSEEGSSGLWYIIFAAQVDANNNHLEDYKPCLDFAK